MQNNMMDSIVMIGTIMVIFWVVLIRPQQKRQKEINNKIAALKTGDRVITIGGVHGTVTSIKPEGTTLVIRVDEQCKLTIDKTAVTAVVTKETKEVKESKEA